MAGRLLLSARVDRGLPAISAIADLTRQLKHDVAGPLLQSACCLQLVDLVVGNRPGQRHVLPAMTRLATYTLTIALLAVLVLVLAGCGSGNGGGY